MTAATVVSTWSLKVRSLTSRLFLAMRICRELTPGPKPCNRCWVKPRVSDELVAGLKSAARVVAGRLGVVQPEADGGAGEEALLDSEVAHVLRLDERIGAGEERAGLRRGDVAPSSSCR